jgi:hypothetical protein
MAAGRPAASNWMTGQSQTFRTPTRGDMTFRTVIGTMGGHDLNHLSQLETAAA